MGDVTQQPATDLGDDQVTHAGLSLETGPDSTKAKAELPAAHASDLLPLTAIVAGASAPAATFWAIDMSTVPWWALIPLGLLELIAPYALVIWIRRQPSGR